MTDQSTWDTIHRLTGNLDDLTPFQRVQMVEDLMGVLRVSSADIDRRNILEGMEEDLKAQPDVIFNLLVRREEADIFDDKVAMHAWEAARDRLTNVIDDLGLYGADTDQDVDETNAGKHAACTKCWPDAKPGDVVVALCGSPFKRQDRPRIVIAKMPPDFCPDCIEAGADHGDVHDQRD